MGEEDTKNKVIKSLIDQSDSLNSLVRRRYQFLVYYLHVHEVCHLCTNLVHGI